MKIGKSTKIGIGVVAIAAIAWYALPKLQQASRLASNLITQTRFGKIIGFKNFLLEISLLFSIRNVSGFDLKVTNYFAKIQTSANGKEWARVGYMPEIKSELNIKNNQATNGEVRFMLQPSILKTFASKQVLFRVVTRYEFAGIPRQEITSLDLTQARNGLLKAIGLAGLSSIYSSKEFQG